MFDKICRTNVSLDEFEIFRTLRNRVEIFILAQYSNESSTMTCVLGKVTLNTVTSALVLPYLVVWIFRTENVHDVRGDETGTSCYDDILRFVQRHAAVGGSRSPWTCGARLDLVSSLYSTVCKW